MADSFIKYKKKGYYMNDTFTELSLIYIVQEINKEKKLPEWLDELKKWWNFTSTGATANCVELKLEKFIINDTRKYAILYFIELAKKTVKNKNGFISVEEYNSYIDESLKSRTQSTFPTDKLLKSIEALISLVKGEIEYTIDDRVWFP